MVISPSPVTLQVLISSDSGIAEFLPLATLKAQVLVCYFQDLADLSGRKSGVACTKHFRNGNMMKHA